MDERVKWFLTGLVAACAVFLSCVLLTTAVLLFGDYENDAARHDVVRTQPNSAGDVVPRTDSN
jgi:hypothetical protein